MGLDEVYESLVELFPLIDCRALRAVAIDHHKDVDAAVLAVVDEIIPLLESTTPLDQSICEARSEASTSGAYDGHREGVDNRPMSASGAVQSCGGPVKITSDGTIDVQDLDMGVDQIGNLTPEVESVSGQLEIDRVNKESDVLVGPSESFVSSKESTMSESREVRTVDFVEESIQEARDNKETVSMAMESVISLMRQVVLKEQAVEQAKVEAGIGGKNTLDKVEELKRMLQNAKAANEMHAGEVYGEKSILGTELKDLQARVLSMSDEREKSLSVLDEVRLTLEVRLDAAENAIRSAEHEKLEKENAARKLHAEQKLVMEKVVQESKILKQQSEENTKLEEFLVDRGRAIDTLQKLTLETSSVFDLEDGILETIGSLPLLEKLKLKGGCFLKGKWKTVEGQFSCLKHLELRSCRGLENWSAAEEGSDILPRLQHLSLMYLKELEEIPYELGNIDTLKSIKLIECGEGAVKSAKEMVEEQVELQGVEQISLFVKVPLVRDTSMSIPIISWKWK